MNIVTRSARKASRLVYGNPVSEKATRAHRAHRRQVSRELNSLVDEINCGAVRVDDVNFDNNPKPKHTVTKYDVS